MWLLAGEPERRILTTSIPQPRQGGWLSPLPRHVSSSNGHPMGNLKKKRLKKIAKHKRRKRLKAMRHKKKNR
jgi:hypothetical protein